jgi:hypothetical protein
MSALSSLGYVLIVPHSRDEVLAIGVACATFTLHHTASFLTLDKPLAVGSLLGALFYNVVDCALGHFFSLRFS